MRVNRRVSPFEVPFRSSYEQPISFVLSCFLRLSFYWSLHDRRYPLIVFSYFDGLNNSVLLKTFSIWIHILWLAWALLYLNCMGVMFYLLWSFLLIFIIALGVSIYAFDTWIKHLIGESIILGFELHVDVWILWYNTRTHLVYSLTFLYQLYDWIS